MAVTLATGIGLGLAAVGAVGGGISAYNSYQQGKAQDRIAQYNFALQQKNAAMQRQFGMAQMQASMAQARVMEATAGINKALSQHEAGARISNAEALRRAAEDKTAVDRENIRRERENHRRQIATQRARIASSGTVESGSPLEILSSTAGEMQQALNELHYQSDVDRRKSFGEAAMEEFGGKLAFAGAEANYGSGMAEAGFARQAASLEGAKAMAGYSQARRQANIDLMTGQSNAQGLKTGAWGTLLSSVGTLGSQWTSWRNMSGGNAAPGYSAIT